MSKLKAKEIIPLLNILVQTVYLRLNKVFSLWRKRSMQVSSTFSHFRTRWKIHLSSWLSTLYQHISFSLRLHQPMSLVFHGRNRLFSHQELHSESLRVEYMVSTRGILPFRRVAPVLHNPRQPTTTLTLSSPYSVLQKKPFLLTFPKPTFLSF